MLRSDLNSTEYFQYYKTYIDLVDDIPLIDVLLKGLKSTTDFFRSIPTEKQEYRYRQGKWTPKDILLHLIDTERVFVYRALYFSRNPNSEIKGFDENVFASNADANLRTIENLLEEYESVRNATITFFEYLKHSRFWQTGLANNNILSVRACGFIIGGHEIHHIRVIQERYL